MPNNRLGRHARRWISVGIIVVVAGSGGATAWAVTGPSGASYRTATVTRGDVTQSLISTGTIEPVSEANVSFPVSGQVSSVSVSLGSHVDRRAGPRPAQHLRACLRRQFRRVRGRDRQRAARGRRGERDDDHGLPHHHCSRDNHGLRDGRSRGGTGPGLGLLAEPAARAVLVALVALVVPARAVRVARVARVALAVPAPAVPAARARSRASSARSPTSSVSSSPPSTALTAS